MKHVNIIMTNITTINKNRRVSFSCKNVDAKCAETKQNEAKVPPPAMFLMSKAAEGLRNSLFCVVQTEVCGFGASSPQRHMKARDALQGCTASTARLEGCHVFEKPLPASSLLREINTDA